MPNNNADLALAAERRQQAFELRKAGASYRQIGEALKVTHTQARRYVEQILAALHKQNMVSADIYRAMQLERLDAMLFALWPAAKRGDTAAIRETLRVMEREAKLMGLDAPTRIDLDNLVRRLATEDGLDPDEAIAEAERIAGRFHSAGR